MEGRVGFIASSACYLEPILIPASRQPPAHTMDSQSTPFPHSGSFSWADMPPPRLQQQPAPAPASMLGSEFFDASAWQQQPGLPPPRMHQGPSRRPLHSNALQRPGRMEAQQPHSSSAVQMERRSMQHAKGVLEGELQLVLQKVAVQEGREARVRALISDLEELRGGSQSLSDRILQVIEIVQDINSVRLEDDGPYNYIRTEFAHRIMRNSQRCVPLWLQKSDATGQLSAVQQAVAFANGDAFAGTVCIQLTRGSYRNQVISLREICAFSRSKFTSFYTEYIMEIRSLLQQADESKGQQQKAELLESVSAAVSELISADHLFFIANPAHFRCSEHWVLRQEPEEGGKQEAMERAAAKAMEVGTDLRSTWGLWDNRCRQVGALEERTQQLRQEISQAVVQLTGGQAAAPVVDYSLLLDLVGDLKWHLDEASVVNSTAISTSVLCMLTPLQAASIMAASYPHLPDMHYMYGRGLIPRPHDVPCTLEELPWRQPPR